ncbi:MAG: glutaredoxin 3 [Neisseriaceae bacterium]|nr:glutaredoxin 3 [Neisseriaceae bacterium]
MKTVTLYTSAGCPFCVRAKSYLKQHGVTEINEIRIDIDENERTIMMEKTGRRTVPQIFIGDSHVGGSDDLQALPIHELNALLAN